MDQVGTVLAKEALEMMDSLVKCDSRRKQNWYVHENQPNTLATIFGEVHYQRTYYKHKTEKSIDIYRMNWWELMHTIRWMSLWKPDWLKKLIDTPYARSGRKAAETLEISSQSVMNSIKELGSVSNNEVKISRPKETAKTLYIEADEDPVALQSGGCAEPRLVYVHEGKKESWERPLPASKCTIFGGCIKSPKNSGMKVADYIDCAYDYEQIEKIYLSGDGASWIKSGAGIINKSIFVLDRYHLNKAIKAAGAHLENAEIEIWRAIKRRPKNI